MLHQEPAGDTVTGAIQFNEVVEQYEQALVELEELALPRVKPPKTMPNKDLLFRKSWEYVKRVPKHTSWKVRVRTHKPWGNRPEEELWTSVL